MITKGLRKNLEAIPRKQSIVALQKTAILGTSHIILRSEAWMVGSKLVQRSTRKKSLVTWDSNKNRKNNNNSAVIAILFELKFRN